MAQITRDTLRRLTGCEEGLDGAWQPAGPAWQVGAVRVSDGMILGAARPIPARLLHPPTDRATGAGLVYAHAHGNRYDIGKAEVTDGRPALLDPPLGLHLAGLGYTVLCPDLPGFGDRMNEGTESALSKAALWHGRPLLGHMLDDLARAHAALASLPRINAQRIGVLGVSMGATLAYWHAALRADTAAVAHFCAFAHIGPLVASGAHDLHGHYMTVPGLLPDHDMGDVAALIAPRPQWVGAGLRDPLSPPEAFDPAVARLRAAYADAPERLQIVVEPEGGHAETPRMRAGLGAFLQVALG
jgi:dienelactone hydrolase